MKPLLLHGHERSITKIRYNREGDLLFTSAKDQRPTVWWSVNGERLGTYEGHGGAVWSVDVSWDSKYLISASADNSARIWDVETGKQLAVINTKSPVRTCEFSYSGKTFMISTDKSMGYSCEVSFYDLAQCLNTAPESYLNFVSDESKVTSTTWGPLDGYILTGHENGSITKYDAMTGDIIKTIHEHSKAVIDIQKSRDQMLFITASKDNLSKLFDTDTGKALKTYKTERPVNSAAISPILDHVVLGGGQEAMEVTTSSTRIGKFDARFYHLIFEEEIGRVKGHFGPINSVAFHPDGQSYSSGGEDGYVRVHTFDPSYHDFKFEF